MQFYHSFPRCPNQHDHQYGLQVLDSILRIGLLITPEERFTTKYKNSLHQVVFIQRRVCFTALEPASLPEHAKFFGEFALEFEPDTLRELGALPAFYLAASLQNGALLHDGGEKLLRLIFDAYRIMGVLWHHRDHGITEVRDFIKDHVFQPKQIDGDAEIQEVFFGLQTLLNLYYPTDDYQQKLGQNLGYYRQREWKVVPNFAMNNKWQYPDVPPAEKAALLALNHGYFSKVLKPDNLPRIDLCQCFQGFGGESLLNRVKRLIVPDAVFADAQQQVNNSPHNFQVVPLSQA